MRLFHRSAADSLPVSPDIEQRIKLHRSQTAEQWSETLHDIALGEVERAHEEVRRTRTSIIVVTLLAILLALAGTIWTYNVFMGAGQVMAAPLNRK